MKIVMTYTATDGYTWSSDVIRIFEYESTESLFSDFVDILRKTKVALDAATVLEKSLQAAYVEAIKKHQSSINPNSGSTEVQAAFAAWRHSRRGEQRNSFVFCGHEWEITDFYQVSLGEETECLPDVASFDEWFAAHGLWAGRTP